MAGIPSSEMPGHARLHQRVIAALDRCQETQDIDFKESQDWDTLRHHIVRSAMAMSNLRDGGVIVIGVAERNRSWSLSGISIAHLGSYDPDDVIDHVNKYASPAVKLDIVTVEHNGNTYLVIHAHEFDHSPTVCRRNSTENGRYFSAGDVLIRSPGKPQTKPVTDAAEMHDLLDLAAEKRARRIIETARRVGLRAYDTTDQRFDEELGGL
jgi:predicted HTH transcriptional regulator